MEESKSESVEETTSATVEAVETQDEVVTETTTEDSTQDADVPEEEVSPEDRLEQLKHFRKNGSISISITPSDFKFVRNSFRDKIEWKGPNEAYLLNILNMGLNAAMSQFEDKNPKEQNIQISNSSIEIMNRLQHRIIGKNSHTALTYMGLFGLVNNCAGQLGAIDDEVNKLKAELGIVDDEEKSEKNG